MEIIFEVVEMMFEIEYVFICEFFLVNRCLIKMGVFIVYLCIGIMLCMYMYVYVVFLIVILC